jgi:excisionase family DNA binding protein
MCGDCQGQPDRHELRQLLAEVVEQHFCPLLKKLEEARAQEAPAYLSIQRAARLGDFSYDFVRRAVERGELPATDKGTGKKRLHRIARADFDSWMKKDRGGKHLPPRSELKGKMSRYLPGVEG